MKVTTFHGSLRCYLCDQRVLIAVKVAHTNKVLLICRDCAALLTSGLIKHSTYNVETERETTTG